MSVNIILEERLCDEAMERLADAGAEITVDATLADAAAADAVILSGKASLADALYAEDAAVRVLGCLGPENTNFDRARATRAGIMVLEPRYGEAASVADDALYLMLSMAPSARRAWRSSCGTKRWAFSDFRRWRRRSPDVPAALAWSYSATIRISTAAARRSIIVSAPVW